jgi:hypothetical protein
MLLGQAQINAAVTRYDVTAAERAAIEQSLNGGALATLLEEVDLTSDDAPGPGIRAVFSACPTDTPTARVPCGSRCVSGLKTGGCSRLWHHRPT